MQNAEFGMQNRGIADCGLQMAAWGAVEPLGTVRTSSTRSLGPLIPRSLPFFVPLFLAWITGCNLLLPAAFVGNPQRKMPAEFDKLVNVRAAVLVWAEPETLFHYPHIRWELSARVCDQLASKLNTEKSRLEMVDPRDLEDFIQKNRAAANDPARVGREFKADYVVFVELNRFQIRDPDSPELLHARIDAGVSVYDVRAEGDQPRRYELAAVAVVHPETGPVLMSPTNPLIIRQEAYDKFADVVARKFYDHTVDL